MQRIWVWFPASTWWCTLSLSPVINLVPFSGLCRHCTQMIYIHTCRWNTLLHRKWKDIMKLFRCFPGQSWTGLPVKTLLPFVLSSSSLSSLCYGLNWLGQVLYLCAYLFFLACFIFIKWILFMYFVHACMNAVVCIGRSEDNFQETVPPRRCWRWNSGCQDWWQPPIPVEPSHQSCFFVLKAYLFFIHVSEGTCITL